MVRRREIPDDGSPNEPNAGVHTPALGSQPHGRATRSSYSETPLQSRRPDATPLTKVHQSKNPPGGFDDAFATVFAKPGAAQRRQRALKTDKRSDAEVAELFRDLDGLIAAIEAVLRPSEAPQVEAPPPPPLPAPDLDKSHDVTPEGLETAPPELPPGAARQRPPTKTPPAVRRPKKPRTRPPKNQPVIAPLPHDARAVELLYQDIVWLVSIDDWGGALISLERLLVSARLDGLVKEFIDVNEVKLLNLYESYLGPFDKVPTRRTLDLDNTMPSAYARAEKLAKMLAIIDGKRDINELFAISPYTPLETCSALNQLRRSGIVAI